jgi:geranylgeranyl reductase
MFDIAIIGSGPAGATLARLLGHDMKIALFEKRDTDDDGRYPKNEKCCGGLLAPDAQRALAVLSLGLPRHILVDPQLFAVHSIDLATGQARHYQRHYLNIDRRRFDAWLRSLVPERVTSFPAGLVTAVTRGPRGFIVSYRSKGRALAIEARLVVGADGARSLLRNNLLAGREPARRYFAIQEWFDLPDSPPFFSAFFDPAITDFYAWSIPKNGACVVGAALDPARRPVEKFELLKQKLRERGMLLGAAVKRHSAFLLRPLSRAAVISGRDGLLPIGEAAGLVSPSSGEGLSFALESASLLATAIRSHGLECGPAYDRALGGLRRKIALKILKAPVLYTPWIRRAVMASGALSVELVPAVTGAAAVVPALGSVPPTINP